MLEPRNVVPFYELPIYRTANFGDLKGVGRGYVSTDGTLLSSPTGSTATLNSANVQLNCVPDKLIIFVRKVVGNLNCGESDSYLTIKRISLSWNNQAGLLSSMSPEQLYRNSIASGLANLTWDEFSGQTISVAGSDLDMRSEARHWHTGVGARSIVNGTGVVTGANPGFKVIPTTGSILVLDFASVIQLTEEYYAPGSLGTFNLQLQFGCGE